MIESMNTLYKRDNKGKIRSWTVQVQDDTWRVEAGILDGNLVISEWRKSVGKNIGKTNETTGHQQALAESNAKHKKQIEKGYFSNITDIDSGNLFKPMLAHDYSKLKKPIEFPVVSQPKLDGIRCIAKADGLWTRSGKRHVAIPHIMKALEPVFLLHPNLVLDGELYNHDLKEDFNKIVSLVRKSKPSPSDILESSKLVEYHVYDMVNDFPFISRSSSYVAICRKLNTECIVPVPNRHIESLDELDATYAEYISNGFEGQMIRTDGLYENKRSKNLLKRKDFITDEFYVTGVEEGLGNWSGCVKRFRLRDRDGIVFSAGVRGNQAQLKILLEGKSPDWATLRYFELTPDGIPRFPVVIDYGWDKRED